MRSAAAVALVAMLSGSIPTGLHAQTDTPPLGCEAAGYDVLLSNEGDTIIPAGTPVEWTVRFVRKSGTLELDEPLAPGESTFVSGGLGSDYLSSKVSCSASIANGA